MKEKTTMHRVWWFDAAHMKQAEDWLSDLAAEGWQLTEIGLRFAKFVRKEPANLRYLCVRNPYFNASYMSQKSLVETYRESGWQFIDTREQFLVFCAPEGTQSPPEELNRQPTKRIKGGAKRAIILLILLMPLVALAFFMFSSWDFVVEVLLRHSSVFLIFGLCVIGVSFLSIVELIDKKHIQARTNGIDSPEITASYRKIIRLERLNAAVFIIIYLLLITSSLWSYSTWMDADTLPSSLVAVQLMDITGQPDSRGDSSVDGEYYLAHSIFYPEQLPAYNSFDHANNSVILDYQTYRALSPWLADILAYSITKSDSFINGNILIPESPAAEGLDRLWRYDGDGTHRLVAVKASIVYCMSLDGNYTTDDMLRALLHQIHQANISR